MKPTILIHIPKNAGSAIKHFVPTIKNAKGFLDSRYKIELEKTFTGKPSNRQGKAPNYTHCRWVDLSKEAKTKFTAVAVVRNPWDRVVSRYTFREIIRKNNKGVYDYITFEEFLEERFITGNKKHFWHRAVDGWFPQTMHVLDNNNNLKCDILRYEYLNKDIKAYFGNKINVGWKNVSNGDMAKDRSHVKKRKDYREYYTEETKKIVADWYHDDIEFFGFTFDGAATKNIWNKK